MKTYAMIMNFKNEVPATVKRKPMPVVGWLIMLSVYGYLHNSVCVC